MSWGQPHGMFSLVVKAPKEIPAPLLWLWLSIPIIALTQLGVVQKRGRFWKNLDHLPGQVYSSITSTCISTPDEVGWGQTIPRWLWHQGKCISQLCSEPVCFQHQYHLMLPVKSSDVQCHLWHDLLLKPALPVGVSAPPKTDCLSPTVCKTVCDPVPVVIFCLFHVSWWLPKDPADLAWEPGETKQKFSSEIWLFLLAQFHVSSGFTKEWQLLWYPPHQFFAALKCPGEDHHRLKGRFPAWEPYLNHVSLKNVILFHSREVPLAWFLSKVPGRGNSKLKALI